MPEDDGLLVLLQERENRRAGSGTVPVQWCGMLTGMSSERDSLFMYDGVRLNQIAQQQALDNSIAQHWARIQAVQSNFNPEPQKALLLLEDV